MLVVSVWLLQVHLNYYFFWDSQIIKSGSIAVGDRLRGQSSRLLSQRTGFDSRRYQIFGEVVSLERGSLSLGGTIEELLEEKAAGSV
jgi:hypothetical protein